jgi:hypothetical protein
VAKKKKLLLLHQLLWLPQHQLLTLLLLLQTLLLPLLALPLLLLAKLLPLQLLLLLLPHLLLRHQLLLLQLHPSNQRLLEEADLRVGFFLPIFLKEICVTPMYRRNYGVI